MSSTVTHVTIGPSAPIVKQGPRASAGLASSSSDITRTSTTHFQAGSNTLSRGPLGLPTTVLLVVTLPSVEPLTV
jgi:hypothetical protein